MKRFWWKTCGSHRLKKEVKGRKFLNGLMPPHPNQQDGLVRQPGPRPQSTPLGCRLSWDHRRLPKVLLPQAWHQCSLVAVRGKHGRGVVSWLPAEPFLRWEAQIACALAKSCISLLPGSKGGGVNPPVAN